MEDLSFQSVVLEKTRKSLGQQDQTSQSLGKLTLNIYIGRTDAEAEAEAEAPLLWPPDSKC